MACLAAWYAVDTPSGTDPDMPWMRGATGPAQQDGGWVLALDGERLRHDLAKAGGNAAVDGSAKGSA